MAAGVDAVVRYPVPLPRQPALAGPAALRHPCPVAGDLARKLAEAGAAHDDDTDDEMREARGRGEGG